MNLLQATALATIATLLCASIATPQPQIEPFRLTVTSNADTIQPDDGLTLREAIELVNGTLAVDRISPTEQRQVSYSRVGARIDFNLPPGQTTIQLTRLLPALTLPNVVIDGTTQPGYDQTKSATAEILVPIPVVAITPAEGVEVFRGLTLSADRITIRGLSLYGFTAEHLSTAITPPADIFIAHRLPPPDTTQQQAPEKFFPFYEGNVPPRNVLIENNWLGIPPDGSTPRVPSAFGVSVFNSQGTTIRRNRISYHDGSGIITSVRAENTLVLENIIVNNGLAGMPDAIRLEGVIDRSQITKNLICGNDGSGIFLFKPQGTVQITENRLSFNGRRLRRAAIYLMGNDHQVLDNDIRNQAGPGVVVTSYPESIRNLIRGNRFSTLEGLSIDLNTQQNVTAQDFQRGDGVNPPRNSPNRRRETGNAAINAPQFLASEFFILGDRVNLDGIADPGSQVDLYRVEIPTDLNTSATDLSYGFLSQALTTVTADAQGRFRATSIDLQPGDRISAIATDPQYGTSEPAIATLIRDLSGTKTTSSPFQPLTSVAIPRCTTPPAIAQTPPTPPEPIPQRLTLQVPNVIHFALDKDTISDRTARVLDRIAQVLNQNPTIVIDLEGHTDPRASDAYNIDLGLRRARSARNYLLRRGIGSERMTIRTLGERRRQTMGSDRVDYARDRRVEVLFKDVRGVELTIEPQESDLQIEPAGGQ